MPPVSWLWSAPVLWLLLATAMLVLALLGLDTDGLILVGGIAALLLTLVTALAPLPPLLAMVLFVGVSAVGYGWLRRWSRRQQEAALPSSGSADHAEVISGFGSGETAGSRTAGSRIDCSQGRVRWQGQSWAAVNLDGSRLLQPGAQVVVMGRDGTRLQVLPDGD